jgi:hypothetical protein
MHPGNATQNFVLQFGWIKKESHIVTAFISSSALAMATLAALQPTNK